ncbi:MAG: TetR family transcriptional regulator [Solirubrobacterales bacterium]|nr:TetR family transcriptional regulator [Solirubrobacterales bacterium]
MGRPKIHDDATRATLLRAAENLAESEGLSAVSLRRLATETGLSTRAAYSTFGSKAGLIDALGALAFDWLADQVRRMPETDDPARDLVETAQIFRRLAIEHTVIFQTGFQSESRDSANPLIRRAAARALGQLTRRVERVVPPERVRDTVLGISALCEGLATHELRGSFDAGRDPVETWRAMLSTHVAGLRPPE